MLRWVKEWWLGEFKQDEAVVAESFEVARASHHSVNHRSCGIPVVDSAASWRSTKCGACES